MYKTKEIMVVKRPAENFSICWVKLLDKQSENESSIFWYFKFHLISSIQDTLVSITDKRKMNLIL